MNERFSQEEWAKDFACFLSAGEAQVPSEVASSVQRQISDELHPSELKVFARLSFVHLLSATATLSVCPQFGFSLTAHSISLMHLFMRFGNLGCSFFCGAFFLGVTGLAAGMLFKAEDVKVLRGSRILQFFALALLSMGAFICLSGALVTLDYALAWITGSVLASFGGVELVTRLRFKKRFCYLSL